MAQKKVSKKQKTGWANQGLRGMNDAGGEKGTKAEQGIVYVSVIANSVMSRVVEGGGEGGDKLGTAVNLRERLKKRRVESVRPTGLWHEKQRKLANQSFGYRGKSVGYKRSSQQQNSPSRS